LSAKNLIQKPSVLRNTKRKRITSRNEIRWGKIREYRFGAKLEAWRREMRTVAPCEREKGWLPQFD